MQLRETQQEDWYSLPREHGGNAFTETLWIPKPLSLQVPTPPPHKQHWFLTPQVSHHSPPSHCMNLRIENGVVSFTNLANKTHLKIRNSHPLPITNIKMQYLLNLKSHSPN
jgi:hypothetical protein